mgnify:FL=1
MDLSQAGATIGLGDGSTDEASTLILEVRQAMYLQGLK